MAFSAATTPLPSSPSHQPTLKGIPMAEFQLSFCVENPFRPMCARMLGSDAGNPKQSGSMYSALVLPNSLVKYCVP